MKPTMLARVQAYLAHRRALGFKLESEGLQLLNFARYADAVGHRGPLTRQLAIRWACLPKQAERVYWARRLAGVRTFAKHLMLTEPNTQLPPRHLFGPAYRRHPPHLYSSEQIQHLLRHAGQLTGRLRPHTFQTLLCLLACTGLRISEALNLKASDVDLEQAVLLVRESKYGKHRLVPLHATAIPPLRAYARYRQRLFPVASYFFVTEQGRRLTYHRANRTFIRLRAGIPYQRRPPRLHDLRHTMACQVLQRWQASPTGAVQRLAVLARFLGHTYVKDTYWYFTAFPQLLTDALQQFQPPDHEHS